MKTNEVRLIDANELRKKTYPFPCAIGVEYAVPLRAIDEAPTLTLNTLRDAIYEDAVEHGLYALEKDVPEIERAAVSLVSRIKSETNEARNAAIDWEAHRSGAQDHFAEELADVIIMTLSTCGHLGIDIDAAVRRKIEINKARPWKHEKENEGEA